MSVEKPYRAYVYDRTDVTDPEIMDLIQEVLGISSGDLQRLVFDGKVTPVVCLNFNDLFDRAGQLTMVAPNHYDFGEVYGDFTFVAEGVGADFHLEMSVYGADWVEYASFQTGTPLVGCPVYGEYSRLVCDVDGVAKFIGMRKRRVSKTGL